MDKSLYEQFAEIEWTHWWFVARRRILGDLLARKLQPNGDLTILDAGCGAGAMIGELTRFGVVTGMDSSPKALEYSRAVFPDQVFFLGDVPGDLPREERFDVVTLLDVVEHIPDDIAALRGIRESLRPGGLLVCTVPAHHWLWGPHDALAHHARRYNKRHLQRVLKESGFKIERTTYYNSILFPIVVAVRLLRTRLLRRTEPRSDDVVPSRPINKVLESLFAAERYVLRHTDLPMGVSLIAFARRV